VAALSVIPYRDVVERGLFSTRAPARVNPLGLSNVKLIESVWKSVAGATILVAGCCKRNSRSWL
jgi:tRNA (Thr-GGU) A37 N-methylase